MQPTVDGPGARALFTAIERHGDRPLEPVIARWLRADPDARAYLSVAATPQARLGATPEEHEEVLWELYGLSRVSDLLLLGGLGDRVGPYLELFGALGMEAAYPDEFDPFDCEIVRVHQADDPHAPIRLAEVRWPGLRLGQLLFSRAGVAVTAGAAVATAGVADRSPLYWTWRRDGRRTCDLSHGWGHNSQWRTALRRDYRTPEGDVLNVDGTLRAVHPADDSDSEKLAVDRRVELLRHRCLLTPLDDPAVDVADLWPYDWTMRVRAAGGLWSVP